MYVVNCAIVLIFEIDLRTAYICIYGVAALVIFIIVILCVRACAVYFVGWVDLVDQGENRKKGVEGL